MPKTIQELSEEYYPTTIKDSWEVARKALCKQIAFESGANAVLESIDFAIRTHSDNPYEAILNTIKELKGE